MNEKKLYIWRLAEFLARYNMRMSVEELAEHLNRNNFLTNYGTEYEGGRGTYTLVNNTQKWIRNNLGLKSEADKVVKSFVKPDGSYAFE